MFYLKSSGGCKDGGVNVTARSVAAIDTPPQLAIGQCLAKTRRSDRF
jgi:hypothetical protein